MESMKSPAPEESPVDTTGHAPAWTGTLPTSPPTSREQPVNCGAERGVLRVHWPVACTALGASFTLDVGCGAR